MSASKQELAPTEQTPAKPATRRKKADADTVAYEITPDAEAQQRAHLLQTAVTHAEHVGGLHIDAFKSVLSSLEAQQSVTAHSLAAIEGALTNGADSDEKLALADRHAALTDQLDKMSDKAVAILEATQDRIEKIKLDVGAPAHSDKPRIVAPPFLRLGRR